MARGGVPRHGTPCAHPNPTGVARAIPAEADSAQNQAGLGAERQDQLLLGLLLLGLHLLPKAEYNICLRGGKAMDDPRFSTQSKAKLTTITSRLASPHAACQAAFPACMRPRWARGPFSLHLGPNARWSG